MPVELGSPRQPIRDLAAGGATTIAIIEDLEPCPADLAVDREVNGIDLGLLFQSWGTAGADLDGDGTTGGSDLAQLFVAWGPCPE